MELRTPPLSDVHAGSGATTTSFGGWEMPVEFASIRTEHEAVRASVGKFDVSHMGEIEVRGPDATELLQRLITNDVEALDPGEGLYSAITDERGVLLDDTVVYDLPDGGYLFVPNAGHDEEMYERWCGYREEWGLDCTVENATDQWAMIAVQGPESVACVGEATPDNPDELQPFEIGPIRIAGHRCLCSRTGYTGEDGFELLCSWDDARAVWDAIDCQPCGLGARDTLRIEQGFLLSGQDFDPESNPRTPFEAGIGFTVDLETDFVGRDALAETPTEQFVGIELTERGVPRNGYAIEAPSGERIGTVTSGTMSPTLGVPIGLGYVPSAHAEPGTELRVVIRDDRKAGLIRNPPFEQPSTEP